MPSATWNSGASTDMNNTANYTAVWDATYDLVWNNTSVVNCAATANVSCNSITIANNYSGTWSFAGRTLTCAEGFSDDGITGAHTYGSSLTCNGASATVHFGTGCTITASSCALNLNGTTGMTYDHDNTGGKLAAIVLGASAKVTNTSASGNEVCGGLTLGASAVLTMTSNMRIAADSATPIVLGAGYSIAGAGQIWIRCSTATAITIPAITMAAGKLLFYKDVAGAFAITLAGNMSIGSDLYFRCSHATGAMSVTTNNYSVVTGGTMYVGNQTVSGSLTMNWGSSAVSCAVYDASTYNTAMSTDNLQTSQWTVSGNFTHGSNHTVSVGTSQITFTGTGTTTLNGKSLYGVTVNSSGLTRTFADSLSCCCFTRTAGVVSFSAGAHLTLSGSAGLVIAAVTGNCTFQNITFSAAGGACTQNGTGTVSAQTVTFSDSGGITIGSATTFNKLVCTDGKTYTWSGAGILTITTNAAGDWSGAAGARVTWVGPGKIKAPAGVAVTYMDLAKIDNSTGTTIDGTSNTNINRGGNANWNMVGAARPSGRIGFSLSPFRAGF